jgi:hypothetical protein
LDADLTNEFPDSLKIAARPYSHIHAAEANDLNYNVSPEVAFRLPFEPH